MSDLNKQIKKFMDSQDWEGLAKAYQEAEIKWHAKEWKDFIHSVREEAIREERERILELAKEKLIYVTHRCDVEEFLASLQPKEGEEK